MTVASSEPLASQPHPQPHAADAQAVNPARRYFGFALKCVVTLGTLYWVVCAVSVEQLAKIIVNADWRWLLLALSIFWMAQGVSALRYVYITRTLNCPVPYRLSIRLHFIGLWFNQVFPTGLGGDVVKVLMLKPLIGAGKAFRTTVLDRASGMIFLLASV
ncbi:MAG: lysylphosphatidylglycerol synthase transmembrane domain-containing protein, partial [Alphaproteobacteria bacterium]